MSKPAFIWNPDLGAERGIAPSVNQTKFGDGYELRVAKGLNFTPKSWRCQFSGAGPVAKDILAFLEARAGMEAFEWTDPLGDKATYVCREWSSSQQQMGVYVVSATFEQVFEY